MKNNRLNAARSPVGLRIGARLQELRTQAKRTQGDVANLLNNELRDSGRTFSKRSISDLENHQGRKPDEALIKALSQVLGVEVETEKELLGLLKKWKSGKRAPRGKRAATAIGKVRPRMRRSPGESVFSARKALEVFTGRPGGIRPSVETAAPAAPEVTAPAPVGLPELEQLAEALRKMLDGLDAFIMFAKSEAWSSAQLDVIKALATPALRKLWI
jgi:transcriptional regulator with XRE-family HTH domain